MMLRARACVFGIVLLVAACARREEQTTPTANVDAGTRAHPLDHLAPGELVEGPKKVFGFTVPRLMQVERTFDDVAFASGAVGPDAVAKYVEAHVEGTKSQKVGQGYVFDKARVHGEAKLLRLTITKSVDNGTRLEIRDVTPPPVIDTGPDEEARWRAVGLKPNGEPLDRTKLR
jgi:hypothetical protein